MGAIAAILFAVAFFINGSKTSTNVWFSPNSLMLAGLFCLALHLLGVGSGCLANGPVLHAARLSDARTAAAMLRRLRWTDMKKSSLRPQ